MKKLFFPAMLLAAMSILPIQAEEHSELSKAMEGLNDSYKAFRTETDSAKGAAAARQAQDFILKSIPLVPAMVQKMTDAAAKEKAIAEYRLQMGQLYVTLCEVENAFLAKDNAKVAKLVDSLKKAKKEGHGKFIEDEG